MLAFLTEGQLWMMETNGNRRLGAAAQAAARPAMRRDIPRPGEHANELIVPANLRALQTLYFAAMLEEARLFDVVDRLVAMSSQGLIPVGSGKAGALLYRYWRTSDGRMTTFQRQTVYARAF